MVWLPFTSRLKVANQEKLLPTEFMDYQRRTLTHLFYGYALPILGDPLPSYAGLREARVKKLLPPRQGGCPLGMSE